MNMFLKFASVIIAGGEHEPLSLMRCRHYLFHKDEVKTIVRSSRDAHRSKSAAVYSIQGRRDHMEDRFDILTDTHNKIHPTIFGVFDGHGGESQLWHHFHCNQQFCPSEVLGNVSVLMRKAELVKSIRSKYRPKQKRNRNQGELKVYGGDPVKRNGEFEKGCRDVRGLKGKVEQGYEEICGFIRFNGLWRVQGALAMSRSLGDYPLKNLNVLIPDPDVMTFDLDRLQPQFMILASDGLWDAFSNEEAMHFIKARLDEPHFGEKSIVLQAFSRGCPDNITVMVVKFGKRGSKAPGQ
ncbi:protein phosphatase 1L-like [Carassius carassius]|uniref:protein phosphatase 1L-like n=1 Tax=Carassius carassius TaxID=217509 RepID=UPI0028686D57|nr:protein phosphatase 1L-like [Carassius carassius]